MIASPLIVNCNGLAIPGASCPELDAGNVSAIPVNGSADVKAKVTAFLDASYNINQLAIDMEKDLITSCGELGFAIGLPAAEMKAEADGGKGAEAVCGKVQAKIDNILSASASAKLELVVTPPRCYADIDTMTSCMEGCGGVIEPGELKASCTEGELAGSCSAECTGTCSAQADVKCSGQCDGTCKGTCDGNQVEGKCDGKCDGSCSGGCKLEGSAKCEGTCTGECSAEFTAPKCTGEFKPPKVDATCHAKCSAEAAKSATCEPPGVQITIEGEADADVQKLVQALRVKLPGILKVQLGTGKRAVLTAKSVVEAGAEIPGIAADAGLQAVGCVGAAVSMAASASVSVNVSIEASASVGGSAGTS